MIEINGKKYRNIQEQVEKNMEDIAEIKESGITGYTAGTGIDITEDVISVDTEVIATKEDIPTVPTKTSQLVNDSDFITIADVPVPTAGAGIDILNGTISVDNTVALKIDLVDYYAGTNVYFNPHSGADGYDISVPMKTINGNPINGIGNITLATLTEKFFRVNITVGNPVTKTWYYTFRAESSLDTTLTGIAAIEAYVPEGAIVYSPDDKCLYTIANIVPNSQSTIAKYDGTTALYTTAAFINTTVQAV